MPQFTATRFWLGSVRVPERQATCHHEDDVLYGNYPPGQPIADRPGFDPAAFCLQSQGVNCSSSAHQGTETECRDLTCSPFSMISAGSDAMSPQSSGAGPDASRGPMPNSQTSPPASRRT